MFHCSSILLHSLKKLVSRAHFFFLARSLRVHRHNQNPKEGIFMPHLKDSSKEDCIKECMDCAKVCTETVYQCLELGGKQTEPKHIAMLTNCARICSTSAHFMITGSEQHSLVCDVCAQICTACADDCEALGNEMQECIDACRSCAESCQEMAADSKTKSGLPRSRDSELRA